MAKHVDPKWGDSMDYRIRWIGVPTPAWWDRSIYGGGTRLNRIRTAVDAFLVRGKYEVPRDDVAGS